MLRFVRERIQSAIKRVEGVLARDVLRMSKESDALREELRMLLNTFEARHGEHVALIASQNIDDPIVIVHRGLDEAQQNAITTLDDSAVAPPTAEKIIALLCPADKLEAVLGDLEEAHGFLANRHGKAFAR
ncbi:MAG TPA: hypothetical protein VGC15_10210, partial [Acetobacteraceae bacterium]